MKRHLFTYYDRGWSCIDNKVYLTHFCGFLGPILGVLVDRLDKHIPPIEYRTISRYSLMVPLSSINDVFLVYHKAFMDTFGEHAIHYIKFKASNIIMT